ncbi:MAG TPA: hypothetical protein VGF75_06815, partial [Candidatus Saccharimonadales bacterium]
SVIKNTPPDIDGVFFILLLHSMCYFFAPETPLLEVAGGVEDSFVFTADASRKIFRFGVPGAVKFASTLSTIFRSTDRISATVSGS